VLWSGSPRWALWSVGVLAAYGRNTAAYEQLAALFHGMRTREVGDGKRNKVVVRTKI